MKLIKKILIEVEQMKEVNDFSRNYNSEQKGNQLQLLVTDFI